MNNMTTQIIDNELVITHPSGFVVKMSKLQLTTQMNEFKKLSACAYAQAQEIQKILDTLPHSEK